MSQSYRLKIFRPALRFKVAARIPAQLIGGAGIAITRATGVYTVDLDFEELSTVGSYSELLQETNYLASWESISRSYSKISIADFLDGVTLQTQPAYSVLVNATGSAAVPVGSTIPGLTHKAVPVSADKIMLADSASSNALKYATIAEIANAAGSVAGVTSLNGQTGAVVVPIVPSVRLTLTSGISATESDVTGAASVYIIPINHDRTMVYDGTNDVPFQRSQVTLTLNNPNHVTGENYDVYEAVSGGNVVCGTGPAWSAGAVAGNDTTRGTGAGSTELEAFNGRMVNKNSITLRNGATTYSIAARKANFLGGFRTTGTAQTEDSYVKRFVSSAYETTIRPMKRIEATDSWAYSTATFRQAMANAANQIEFFSCLSGRLLKAQVAVIVATSSGFQHPVAGIGLDSTTTDSSTLKWQGTPGTGTSIQPANAMYTGFSGLGYHKVVWLEKGAGTDTQTWYGDASDATSFQSGIAGDIIQ